MPQTSFDVFLSHNSGDKSIVRELAARLSEHGIRPWLDEHELIPGDSIARETERAIAEAGSVAVLIGPNGIGPWSNLEIRAALQQSRENKTRIIPILLPGAPPFGELPLPPFISLLNFLDLRNGITAEALEHLLKAITGGPDKPHLAVPAEERFDFFLCYLTTDREAVQEIGRQFVRLNIRTWPSDWSLSPVESVRQFQSRPTRQVAELAVVVGNQGGPWVDDEVELFIWERIDTDRPVISVILPDVTGTPKFPVYLRRKPVVDFRNADLDPFSQLLNLLPGDKNNKTGASND